MSKRNLVNLVLLIIALVLVAIVVIDPGKQEPIKPPTLTTLKEDDITSIKIHRLNIGEVENDIEFKKTATGWQLVKPYSVPANAFRVEAILKLLTAPSLSQNDLSNLDLKKFGLATPLVSITFNETKIEFGHNKSLKNHRYVKIGSTLYMIADTFYYQVNAKAESYIDHKLLSNSNAITKLQLPNLTLEQHDGKWQSSPQVNNISADAMTSLIDEWQLSQAYDIKVTKPQPESEPDIRIHFSDQQKTRFKIIGSSDNFVLFNIDTGVEYILAKNRQNKLLKLNATDTQDE